MMESSFARTRLPNRHDAHALKLNSSFTFKYVVPTLLGLQPEQVNGGM